MSRACVPSASTPSGITKRVKIAALALFACSAAGGAACGSGGGSDVLPPITGVIVRAESLTTGRGCGRGAEQVFKYAAVLLGQGAAGTYDRFIAGNVYDCFADGLFVDLPASGGAFDYRVHIYAYNEAAYRAAGGDKTVPPKAQTVTELRTTNPTLTTICSAVQIDLVQTLAVCKPLLLGTSGVDLTPAPPLPSKVDLSTATFPGPDGGVLRCDIDYSVVRSRFSITSASGFRGALSEQIETRCGIIDDKGQAATAVISISPAVAPASYVFEVALLGGPTEVKGLATCRAETSPGLTSSAVCKPTP